MASDCPEPDPCSPVPALVDQTGEQLLPMFRIQDKRSTWRITCKESVIEAVIDRAEAAACGRIERFCEIELELVTGDSGALFRLARAIDAITPARIGVLSKAERGYRLLGPVPEADHGAPVQLDPAMDPVSAFLAIVAQCLRHYRLNETILLERPCPEAVHQARVALRRLRTAFVIFRPLLACPGGDGSVTLQEELRKAAALLGEARDHDVMLASIPPGPVADRIGQARQLAYANMAEWLASPECRRLFLDCVEWMATVGWREAEETAGLRSMALEDYASMALDRLRRRIRKHGHHLGELPDDLRHQLRKDAKKLRYAHEFVGSLFEDAAPRKHRKFGKALSRLQDALGALNDLAMSAQRLGALGLPEPEEGRLISSPGLHDKLLKRAAHARHDLLKITPYWR